MIDIKDIQGNTRFSTGINPGAKGKFSLMKEDYVVLPFNTLSPVDFQVGDYVDLRGVLDASMGGKLAKIYQIVDIPYPTYKNGGYSYELRFDAYYFKWKTKIFKYTPEYGGLEASWSLTASLDVQMGVFLRNLKALGYKYEGKDFVFSIDDSVENSSKLMTYDNTNLIDAMFSMADNWGCDCWVTDHVINFGRCEFSDAVKIELDKEAKDMSRSDSKGTYATRIYAFGSTRNIPTNYRPVDQTTVVNGIVQKRLMLPAGTPYVDAHEGLTDLEAVEAVVVFDDICPKRVGEITGVSFYESEVDNEDGTKTKATFYRFKDSGINFSKKYILEGQELKIRFESGKLNGMEFGAAFNPLGLTEKNDDGTWNPDAQLWEIIRNEDYGRPLPDEVLFPAKGDRYVLYGWNAGKITELGLVAIAEQELLATARKYVAKACIDDGTYTATLNSVWVHKDPINHSFDIGQRINLVNPTYCNGGRLSRVIGFEIKLDLPYDSPQYTIGESTAYSRISDIEGKVEELTFKGQTFTGTGGSNIYVIKTNDATAASNFNVFSALRTLRMFLRKDASDVAEEIINFLKGLLIGKNGSGITVRKDGTSQAVVDRLYVKIKAVFDELQVKRATHVGGEQIITHAGMKCIRVEELEDVYRCCFLAEQDGEAIANEFSVGSLAQAKECNIVEGTTLDASNRYYWREVVAVGRDYIDLSKTVCDEDSDVPQAGDDIIGLGHRTDVDLQSAIVLSSTNETSPSITFYAGINDFNLAGKDVISFGVDKSTGHAYMKVYGTSYIGARDESTYIKYTPEGGVEIKGRFLTMAGEDILTMFTVIEGLIKSEISSVRDEINALNNCLNNASFAADMQYWNGGSNIRIFRVDGRLLYFNSNFYANKEVFVGIVTDGVKGMLRLKNSYIEQANSDFHRHPDFETFDGLKRPRQFTVTFKYLVKRPGTLAFHFNGEDKDGFEEYTPIAFSKELYPGTEFKQMEITGKWNGTGDFRLSFTGDILIHSLMLADDRLADLREEFNMRFEATDKKIQANLDEIRSTAGRLEEYHSEFLLTARNLEAEFTEDLTDTENRITEAYTSAIDLSARGLRAEFSSSMAGLDGKLEKHLSSFHVTAEKIEGMVSATSSLQGVVERHSSAITQTSDRINQLVEKVSFDEDGNITNISKAGLVMTSNFASLFAEQVTETGLVKRAELNFFITRNEAGELISNATIQADQINFTGKTIINGSFVVDTNGRVTMNDITANNLTLKGSITGTDATLNGITANNLTLKGDISGTDATLNDITANNLTLKGNITGTGAALNDITANNITLKGGIMGRDAVLNDITANNLVLKGDISGVSATLNDITANNLVLKGDISGVDAILNDITANNLTLKGNISGTDAVLNDITANGTINASSGRIGDSLYLHGNGISTNPKAFVTDLTDGTTQFELGKSYYLHAIVSDGGTNTVQIRPYQTMEAGTVKGVVTVSATIPGRNRALHVSAGESYFGGDVMVSKIYAPSGILEIAGQVRTRGVYRNTGTVFSSTTNYSIQPTDHTLLFFGNCAITLPSSPDGHEIWVMSNGNTISFPAGTFANASSRTNIKGYEWHVMKRVSGNWYLSWMNV